MCSRLGLKQWGKRNPSRNLLHRYGITIEEKGKMAQAQGNCCLICKNSFKNSKDIHVDHCHDTKKIRGILCHSCNTGLGHFRDSPKLLQRAIHYIEHHAKQITTPSVPEGHHREGEVYPELGPIFTAGTREDYYDLDHYQRTVCGQDADYRTQTRGGDSVGHGGSKVGAPIPATRIEDHGQPESKIISLELRRSDLFNKP